MPDSGTAADLGVLRGLMDAGYGWYLDPRRLRQDDLLVRSRASAAVCRAGEALARAEHAARAAMPAPTRDAPFPDAAALARPRGLRLLHDGAGALETRLRGSAVFPDRDTAGMHAPPARQREELVQLDAALLGEAAALEAVYAGSAEVELIKAALERLDHALCARSALRTW